MDSLVSIIVPIYNAELYVSECIDSILKQTYTNFELLLINDGSTDNTSYICKKYNKDDNRIHYIEKKNEGVSIARNIGLKHASGDYVIFIDSDDIVKPNYLQLLIDKKENDLVVSGFTAQYNNQIIRESKFLNSIIVLNHSNNLLDKVLIFGTPWAKLFKLEIIRRYNIQFNPKLSLHEDHLFYFEYIKYIQSISTIEDVMYIYINRSNGQSLSRDSKQNSADKLLAYNLLSTELRKIIDRNNIKISNIPQTLNFLIRIFISALNSAILEKKYIYIDMQYKRKIKKYYKPISMEGKFQKFCLLNLPFCFYKTIINHIK
ncbi:glycosyltransferase family 2 protein [Coprobacter fastidiosus]|uniref:glycosyltransferase family 2 protein n=1 Tax=Coprobacter fastidiosus TaxID=1099853 RepID=UPI00266F57E2|nr:glycosyltransferase [Coprobacter fastidiosus]